MAKSIISNVKQCFVCGSPYVHKHHVYGAANRKLSEKYGCWVYLCPEHHTGNSGVHFDKEFNTELKKYTQRKFEETYDENFMNIFGRNYL